MTANNYALAEVLAAADVFLAEAGKNNSFIAYYDTLENPHPQKYFELKPGQFDNPTIFAGLYKGPGGQEYLNFYQEHVYSGVTKKGQIYTTVIEYYALDMKTTLKYLLTHPTAITTGIGERLGDAGYDLKDDAGGTLTGWGDGIREGIGGAAERLDYHFSPEKLALLNQIYNDNDAGLLLQDLNKAYAAGGLATAGPLGKAAGIGAKAAYKATASVASDAIKKSIEVIKDMASNKMLPGYIGKKPDYVKIARETGLDLSRVQGSVDNINPTEIRFTQDSIKGTFGDGSSVDDLIDGLKSGKISSENVPPIRIFQRGGEIYSLDNRRLYAFQQAGISPKTIWATPEEIAQQSYKMTTTNGGTSIRVRGGKSGQ